MKNITPDAALLQDLLRQGAATLQLDLDEDTVAKLITYISLLSKWNNVYNLTAVRDPAHMVTRHLLDSLTVVPYIKGPKVLDVGTGAGLPGIPLALVLPNCKVVLLDSSSKKTRFVTQAATELGLSNVTMETVRVENYRPVQGFDTVISRAFAKISDMLTVTHHLCQPHGQWLAMKGIYPEQEIQALPPQFSATVHAVRVPGLDEQRHVVCIEQTNPTR